MLLRLAIPFLLFSTISVIFFLIYQPGLNGSFLLDDYGNLDKLGDYNGVRNLDTLLQYLTSGIAGPTGRPISLLSFLLNANNWPADPFPFKLTNVILHGINGFILFFICRLLLKVTDNSSNKTTLIAVLASIIWLFHPYQVSTVLYVVQRMAMLSTFFSLIGILCYCYGRQLLSHNTKVAYQFMTGGIVIGTGLAILSKENGALLPILILCLEATVFSSNHSTVASLNKRWYFFFLVLPSLLIIVYLLSLINIDTFDTVQGRRNFSLKQRLLTESRLVIGYLYNLIIPQMFYSGIFNESIELSTSLLKPITTLGSVLLVFCLPLLSYILRKRQPFLALAVLFFFSGHLLESTTIKLELYFEHRNYLPSLFLFLPIAAFCLNQKSKLIQVSLYFFIFICLGFTYVRASLWGNPSELSLFWAKQNQTSVRAQRTAALVLGEQGKNIEALKILSNAKTKFPDNIALNLHWAILQCQLKTISRESFAEIIRVTNQSKYSSSAFNILKTFVDIAGKKECTGLDKQKALLVLDSLIQNPLVSTKANITYQFNHLKGLVYLKNEQAKLAYNEFVIAINKSGRVDHGLLQAGLLATYKAFDLALMHLDRTEKLIPNQKITHYFSMQFADELESLREQIELDAKNAQSKETE